MRRAFTLAAAVAALALAGCGGGDADAPACTMSTTAEASAQLDRPVPLTAGLPPTLTVRLQPGGAAVQITGTLQLGHTGIGVDRIVALSVRRDGAELAALGHVAVPVGFRGALTFTVTDPAPVAGTSAYSLQAVDTATGSVAWAMAGSTLSAVAGVCS